MICMADKKKTKIISMIVDDEQKEFQYTFPSTRADGRLYVYINSGRKKPDGNIKYDIIYGSNELKLRKNILNYYDKRLNSGSNKYQTMEVAMTNWLKTVKATQLKPRSYDAMEDNLRLHIFPYVGDLRVCDVKIDDCQEIINKLTYAGYSLSVISKIYVHLNDFFNLEVEKQILKTNPMAAVKKPSESKVYEIRSSLSSKTDKKIKYFTKEQVKAIQDVIYNGYTTTGLSRSQKKYEQHGRKYIYQAPIFDFLLQTGLRVSEMCALRYSNWDQEKHTITIEKTRTVSKKRDKVTKEPIGTEKEVLELSPKSKASRTTISLSKYANDILVKLHSEEKPDYDGYILHTIDGKPMTKDGSLRGRWHRLLAAAGVERKEQVSKTVTDKNGKERTVTRTIIREEYGLHTTRHTYASLLYQQTHDILLVSKKLRHSDPALTARVYISIMEESENQIDETFKV